jgi:hypothetical protein
MGAVALDAQAEQLSSLVGELLVVLTERTQLAASNAPEIEDVPQQNDWASCQAVVQ